MFGKRLFRWAEIDPDGRRGLWLRRFKRLGFASIIAATLYLNITGFVTVHKPHLDNTGFIWSGFRYAYVSDTAGNIQFGWPVPFASYSAISDSRPGYHTILGVDAPIESIRMLPLGVNVIVLTFFVYVCWSRMWRHLDDGSPETRLPFVVFFVVATCVDVAYQTADARDSAWIGEKIEFSSEGGESSTKEFDSYGFQDFTTVRFASDHTVNKLVTAVYWSFRSVCWALVGCWIMATFRGCSIRTAAMMIGVLVFVLRLALDYSVR